MSGNATTSSATTNAAALADEAYQTRLDSLLSSTAQMLAETHLTKLSQTALKSTFISNVACGERHVLFLTSSGFVYAMGSNELGQLGNPCEEVEQTDGTFTAITY